jgi:hypothetical protein
MPLALPPQFKQYSLIWTFSSLEPSQSSVSLLSSIADSIFLSNILSGVATTITYPYMYVFHFITFYDLEAEQLRA